ncbi:hypothetical protein QFC19_001422 [Naganishia cerealis]|uniref:Uncharacterized protein n=1 Tax=Naganishia cerealis TaxID=610337 RepID=A0ACC2WHP0_9TREE|nr:hypothetical protein QFC19_001422 [Naganishia cerealis]
MSALKKRKMPSKSSSSSFASFLRINAMANRKIASRPSAKTISIIRYTRDKGNLSRELYLATTETRTSPWTDVAYRYENSVINH